MWYTHLMVKKKSELEENNIKQEENIIVKKIHDTLVQENEQEKEKLRRAIAKTKDEINSIKLQKSQTFKRKTRKRKQSQQNSHL